MVLSGTGGVEPRLAVADYDEHLVGFYDGEAYLTESIVDFIRPGFAAGDLVVTIVTAAHGRRLRAALLKDGCAVDELLDRGQLCILDADEMIHQLLVDGMPDPRRFRALVGGLMDTWIAAGRSARVCGEMVARLWEAGNVPGMLALEELWNEFLPTRPVALFCPYPMRAFGREESEAAFHKVCDAHNVVLPSELYTEIPEADQRHRAVAVLQHEAVIGINERVALRQALHQREAELRQLRALDRLRARLVEVLVSAPTDPGSVRHGDREEEAVRALQKTALRQVRTVLDAVSCTFVTQTSASDLDDDTPSAVERHVVPVRVGATIHGVLSVEMPADRRLDDHELRFLHAVAGTLAAAMSAHR